MYRLLLVPRIRIRLNCDGNLVLVTDTGQGREAGTPLEGDKLILCSSSSSSSSMSVLGDYVCALGLWLIHSWSDIDDKTMFDLSRRNVHKQLLWGY